VAAQPNTFDGSGLLNRIERTIGKLKQLRRIATRYDRIPQNYTASLCLAAISFWC
jgi:transposase